MADALDRLADPDALREQGLALLQRLAGDTWTDHNAHDPGITVLETLCYALTELGYRLGHPVADLMAEWRDPADAQAQAEAARQAWTAARVLPGAAVTLADLRRLLIDLPGVRNAWVEPVAPVLARHDAAQGLLLPALADAAGGADLSPNILPLRPQGLLQVWLEKAGDGEDLDGGSLVRAAARRLQSARGLGLDIQAITVLAPQPVVLSAAVEIAPQAEPAGLLASLAEAIAQHLSPPVPFRTLREMRERGWRIDQVFEGPRLQQGFLDPDEFQALARRRQVRVSDLIAVLMGVPGVVAVRQLGFRVEGRPSDDWLIAIAADRVPVFDFAASELRLERRGLRVDTPLLRRAAQARLEQARRQRASERARAADEAAAEAAAALAPPAGRSRGLRHSLSLLHHLPTAYGVGSEGLPASVGPTRRALAAQFKAYLLFFDQLLANQHAQLAGVSRLLAFDGPDELHLPARFARPVDDDGGRLQLSALRRGTPEAHARRLERLTRDPWQRGADGSAEDGDDAEALRRHQQLDHLLARAGERFEAHPPRPGGADLAADLAAEPLLTALLRRKLAYLRALPELGAVRGLGEDLAEAADTDAGAAAGLVQRLRALLDLGGDDEPLLLVEHLLLRPLPADSAASLDTTRAARAADDAIDPAAALQQQVPLARALIAADPYSQQLSLVLAGDSGRLADADFRDQLALALQQHLPAQLSLRLLWLPLARVRALQAVQARWARGWRRWLAAGHGGLDAAEAEAVAADPRWIALRVARNRLIDGLGLADTLPLVDLPLARVGGGGSGGAGAGLKVPHGGRARISIEHAEAGVRYELRGPGGRPLLDGQGRPLPAVQVDGQDDTVFLETPPVTEDLSFRVLASKQSPPAGLAPQAAVLLQQTVSVKVGLDTSLALDLPGLPFLDTSLANPQPGDARLVDHGQAVEVEVQASQEGVDYALVINGQLQPGSRLGDLGPLRLATPPLREDCDIAVQASKRFAASGGARSQDVQLLVARLRVCVRADRGLVVQALPDRIAAWRASGLLLRVQQAQAGLRYEAWARPLRDADWVRDVAGDQDGDGTPLLRAGPPPLPAVRSWPLRDALSPPPGFAPWPGAAAEAAQAADLDLPLAGWQQDAVLRVLARKSHLVHSAGTARIESLVVLQMAVPLLARPDPAPALSLRWLQRDDGRWLQLLGGQPGVFYQPRRDGDDRALSLPGYVHPRDAGDATLNRGLGQVRLGVDWVVAADAWVPPVGTAASLPPSGPAGAGAGGRNELPQRDRQPPEPALLALPADLPVDAAGRVTLRWRAIKALSGLDAELSQPALLPPLPQARLEPAFPAPGEAAALRVPMPTGGRADAQAGELWQLWLDGKPLAEPAPPPDSGLLALPAGESDAMLALLLRRPGQAGLPVERWLVLPLRRLPRSTVMLELAAASVAPGQGTELRVLASQAGMLYQLQADGRPLGEARAGGDAVLRLPTGPLQADTRFSVVVQRADAPAAQLQLPQQLLVQVVAG